MGYLGGCVQTAELRAGRDLVDLGLLIHFQVGGEGGAQCHDVRVGAPLQKLQGSFQLDCFINAICAERQLQHSVSTIAAAWNPCVTCSDIICALSIYMSCMLCSEQLTHVLEMHTILALMSCLNFLAGAS